MHTYSDIFKSATFFCGFAFRPHVSGMGIRNFLNPLSSGQSFKYAKNLEIVWTLQTQIQSLLPKYLTWLLKEMLLLFNLVPRLRFSFGQHQEHGVWPLPIMEVCKSNRPSLRLRMKWKWPESVSLVRTLGGKPH